jgi:hypothetical protein
MAKEKRRNWLDKISKWILDALPAEKSNQAAESQKPSPGLEKPALKTTSTLPSDTTKHARGEWQEAIERTQSDITTPALAVSAQSVTNEKTINKAWAAFELAWANAGLGDHYFLEADDLHSTLALLDRSFEEELIEWLFQLCTKPEALRDLAGIIERGQVKPTDNIDAIRAFAYVSVAVGSRPKPSPVQAAPDPIHPKEGLQPPSDAEADSSFEEPQLTSRPTSQPAALTTTFTTEVTEVDQEILPRSEAKAERPQSEADSRPIGNISIEELELSIRSYNCLKRADIHTLLDLAGKTEEGLIEIKNFGQKSADEVRQALERRGLSLPFRSEDVLDLNTRYKAIQDQPVHSESQDDDSLRSLGLGNSGKPSQSARKWRCDSRPGLG